MTSKAPRHNKTIKGRWQGKIWTQREHDYIVAGAGIKTAAEMAAALDRSVPALRMYAHQHGIYLRIKRDKTICQHCGGPRVWRHVRFICQHCTNEKDKAVRKAKRAEARIERIRLKAEEARRESAKEAEPKKVSAFCLMVKRAC